MEPKNKGIGSIVVIALVAVAAFLGGIYYSRGKVDQPSVQGSKAIPTPEAESQPTKTAEKVVGNFVATGETEVAVENGKPGVYYFGASSCPHCKWEYPVILKTVKKFGSEIVFYDNMDKKGDQEVYQKFSSLNQGAIPFILVGGLYAQLGSGENFGEEQEEKNLTAVVCRVTENKPASVCAEVKDLVDQISQ